MDFFQEPPRLTNTYRADVPLREHLERLLPADVLAQVEPELDTVGEDAAGGLLELARQAEREQPVHVPYDPWGRRVDEIRVSPAWEELHRYQAAHGMCAVPYEGAFGEHARVVQHALIHVYSPSSAIYTCPMAMTDAAVRVLLDHAEPELRDRVVPRLTSREPDAWTSGQWMTEREGGSDVGRTATRARKGPDGRWKLYGTKWFTSATTADCALTLARPEGAPEGSGALALFLVELVDPVTGESQIGKTIRVNRLKDKLGTKALPTAELTLDGAFVTPIGDPWAGRGLKKISGMLNVTRAHNAMGAASGMRRGLDLALAYARVRESFGASLIDLPLHRETMAELAVEAEASFALALRVMQLTGRVEHGVATEVEARALRGLLPVTKLLTGKDAVAHASEALESFGGAGYIEDTGLPQLLRNAQVLPIWEGTTNVLSLDLLRATVKENALSALLEDLVARLEDADAPALADTLRLVAAERDALAAQALAWAQTDPELVQAGMRRFALRLGRAYTAALLVEHAAYRLAKHNDDRAAIVARRYAERWLDPSHAPAPTADHAADTARLLT
ncbi:MAG TPA: acyl-CoA dehydrogenase family protein [Egibacteraceae bacterium]|nr:acyl-CoA dehydrogenase family protein [Egibacteraceae bacterium]